MATPPVQIESAHFHGHAAPPAPQVAREVRIHLDLNHPGIIAMYSAWYDASYIYIAMEWAPQVS